MLHQQRLAHFYARIWSFGKQWELGSENASWTHRKSGIASILNTYILILGAQMFEIQNIPDYVPSNEILSHKGSNFPI